MYMDGIHLKDIYNLYLLFGEYKLNLYHIHLIIISKAVNPSLNLRLNIFSSNNREVKIAEQTWP